MMKSMSEAKARVTITISREVLRLVDRAADNEQDSRSAIIERWLRQGMRRSAEGAIARETIAYYRSLSDEERIEDEAFAKALGSAARRVLRSSDSKKRRKKR
jgi:metal-responsive CopG/Arc/MetJ family transcriptional regulator